MASHHVIGKNKVASSLPKLEIQSQFSGLPKALAVTSGSSETSSSPETPFTPCINDLSTPSHKSYNGDIAFANKDANDDGIGQYPESPFIRRMMKKAEAGEIESKSSTINQGDDLGDTGCVFCE